PRAWHLALAATSPDDAIADALERGAADARSRGGVSAAGRALERAARLTADGDQRARRLIAASQDLQLAGHFGEAFALLDEVSAAGVDLRLKADADLVRGRGLMWTGSPLHAHALLAAAADRIEPVDTVRGVLLRIESASALMLCGQPKSCLTVAERAQAT